MSEEQTFIVAELPVVPEKRRPGRPPKNRVYGRPFGSPPVPVPTPPPPLPPVPVKRRDTSGDFDASGLFKDASTLVAQYRLLMQMSLGIPTQAVTRPFRESLDDVIRRNWPTFKRSAVRRLYESAPFFDGGPAVNARIQRVLTLYDVMETAAYEASQ